MDLRNFLFVQVGQTAVASGTACWDPPLIGVHYRAGNFKEDSELEKTHSWRAHN